MLNNLKLLVCILLVFNFPVFFVSQNWRIGEKVQQERAENAAATWWTDRSGEKRYRCQRIYPIKSHGLQQLSVETVNECWKPEISLSSQSSLVWLTLAFFYIWIIIFINYTPIAILLNQWFSNVFKCWLVVKQIMSQLIPHSVAFLLFWS